MSGTPWPRPPRPRTLAPGEQGGAVLDYAALVALVAALFTVAIARGPWQRPSQELGAAVERALDLPGAGHGEEPDGGTGLDPLAAADAARRCWKGRSPPTR